jgi:DNA methylase
MPEDLVKPCVLAGSRPWDVILDPFAGSGTTGKVALELGWRTILIELSAAYVQLIKQRAPHYIDSLVIVGSCFSLIRLYRTRHPQDEHGRRARRNAILGLASFLVYALGRITLIVLNG